MYRFADKVAVITGAGSGFGYEFAKECALRGMKLVLVDVNKEHLKQAVQTLKEGGASVIDILADVSEYEDVEKYINLSLKTYGQIDLLINNAGITVPGLLWELPIQDWEWIMHVNVYSQIYAMKLVIPIMLRQKTDCHILNVASMAGLFSSDGMVAYHTSKSASISLTECVALDLQRIGAKIHMSVFCPGFMNTGMYKCEENRPEKYKKEDQYYQSILCRIGQNSMEKMIRKGHSIEGIGRYVLDGIGENEFYIMPHGEYDQMVRQRQEDIIKRCGPNFEAIKKWREQLEL